MKYYNYHKYKAIRNMGAPGPFTRWGNGNSSKRGRKKNINSGQLRWAVKMLSEKYNEDASLKEQVLPQEISSTESTPKVSKAWIIAIIITLLIYILFFDLLWAYLMYLL